MSQAIKSFSDIRLRIITGVLLAVVALGAVWLGGWAFAVLTAAAAVLILGEWRGLTRMKPLAYRLALALLAIALALILADVRTTGLFMSASVLIGGTLLLILFTGPAGFGLAYAGLPAVCLLWMRALPWGFELIVWMLAVVIATDVFAYLSGRMIGGRKLAPAISPGKTWAGLVGGAVAAFIIGGLVAHYFALPDWLRLSGALMAVLAQFGDLFESWLKRRAGVKDSGRLLPGHGGVMDRVDGLLPVAVVAAAAVLIGMGS